MLYFGEQAILDPKECMHRISVSAYRASAFKMSNAMRFCDSSVERRQALLGLMSKESLWLARLRLIFCLAASVLDRDEAKLHLNGCVPASLPTEGLSQHHCRLHRMCYSDPGAGCTAAQRHATLIRSLTLGYACYSRHDYHRRHLLKTGFCANYTKP